MSALLVFVFENILKSFLYQSVEVNGICQLKKYNTKSMYFSKIINFVAYFHYDKNYFKG